MAVHAPHPLVITVLCVAHPPPSLSRAFCLLTLTLRRTLPASQGWQHSWLAPGLVKAIEASNNGDRSAIKNFVKVAPAPVAKRVLRSACPERVRDTDSGRTASVCMQEESPGIYSFDMFEPVFCDMYLEELDNYKASGLPIRRPNSMNNYGIIVNEVRLQAEPASQLTELRMAVVSTLPSRTL